MNMFTQKHYEAIARILKNTKPHAEEYDALKRWNIIVETFVSEFSAGNERFKRQAFKDAAGYSE
jgi:hypothetical protein